MSKREKRVAVLCFAAAALAAAWGAAGYFTGKETVENIFTVGDLQIGLQEPDWDPEEGDGKNVYPGSCVYKNPTIKNITGERGERACYARMRILLTERDGRMITQESRLALIRAIIRYDDTYTGTYEEKGAGETLIPGSVPGYSLEKIQELPMINPLFSIDETRSFGNEIVCDYMGEDGRGVLFAGEQAALFTVLAIPAQWTNEEMERLGDFQIEVHAEAIQTAGFASREEAMEALDNQTDRGRVEERGFGA